MARTGILNRDEDAVLAEGGQPRTQADIDGCHRVSAQRGRGVGIRGTAACDRCRRDATAELLLESTLKEHHVRAAAHHDRGPSRGEGRQQADAECLNLMARPL
jgi:hypothetical protein